MLLVELITAEAGIRKDLHFNPSSGQLLVMHSTVGQGETELPKDEARKNADEGLYTPTPDDFDLLEGELIRAASRDHVVSSTLREGWTHMPYPSVPKP